MDQQTLLRLIKRELGMSYPRLAAEMGVSERAMEKWSMAATSGDHRAMPLIARKLLVRMLAERKREHLTAGNRSAAETIDAISANADPAILRASLRAFDSLQHSANVIAPMSVSPTRPKHFRTHAEKNAWEEQETLRNARRIRAQNARAR
jgi:hypothetical protein